jgi:arabinogalactan endo-1,4-beta-galactosidase
MKSFFTFIIFASAAILAQTDSFINGADVSFIPQVEDNGGVYYKDGVATDPLEIFKENEINYIRLRLWHTPSDGYCGLERTLEMAARAKQAGFKLLLNFHYSDWWADPGQQNKPAAWTNLDINALSDSLYYYTFNVIKTFDTLNILPDMVQVGNEITPGFLWPDGRVGGSYDNQWPQFTNLLKRAISAVHDAASDSVKIMIHIDRGGNNNTCRWYFDNIRNYEVNFDIIGLSFYPWWHGTLTALRQNVNDLALRYGKDIIVVETAYPWTLQWYDNTGNIVGDDDPLPSNYPPSVNGQYSFLYDLISIVKEVPNGKGTGVFYWAPEWISTPTYGSAWENVVLFDFQGNALNSMRVFKETEIDTSNAINVTFNLNTSTNFDTLTSGSFVQLRGEVVDGADLLASGESILWDANSDVILNNVNGDYWQTTVRVVPGTQLNYKYWTGHSISKPTFLRLGWEGPIQPYDSSSGNFRKFIAGDKDTILQVEYYNSLGTTVNQLWKPFEHKDDSVAVYFRVNMAGVVSTGRFNPEINGPVGIRGGTVDNINILSWDNTNVILSREELSINNGAYWSGAAYYPVSAIGEEQEYKFFIENDAENGWENNIPNRTFKVPLTDTTISWVYFDNQTVVTDIDQEITPVSSFILYQNFPNPFNPMTQIGYELEKQSLVKLIVYNSLGEQINLLVNDIKSAGKYFIYWDGKDSKGNNLPSGIYLIRLNTDSGTKSIKSILLR